MRIFAVLFSAVCLFFSSLVLADPLDLNTATAEQLASTLTGVGDAKAQAIVAYREANGDFLNPFELANVKGIGERTVELNEDRIVLRD